MSKNANLGALSIMYVVINKRAEVIALLVKNGVQVPSNATDMQLALMVTNLLKVSKAFGRDFNKLLSQKEVISGIFQGFDGSYSNAFGKSKPFSNLPTFDKDLFSSPATPSVATTTATTSSTKSDNSSSPSWLAQGLNLLQTGFQGYLALDQNKTQRELANASVQIKQTDLALADKGILPSGNTPTPTGLSKGAIVGLSVLGIAVVGGVLYFALKKQ